MECQPIETAPKDGSKIIAWNSIGVAIARYARNKPARFVALGSWDTKVTPITHWMPLPEPPKTDA